MSHLNNFVSDLRVKARTVLRLDAIEASREGIYDYQRRITEREKDLEYAKKIVPRSEYNLNKLDPEHPDFAEKEAIAKKQLEEDKKRAAELIKNCESDIARFKETVAREEEMIAKAESGEFKVNIAELNEKVMKWISTMKPEQVPDEPGPEQE